MELKEISGTVKAFSKTGNGIMLDDKSWYNKPFKSSPTYFSHVAIGDIVKIAYTINEKGFNTISLIEKTGELDNSKVTKTKPVTEDRWADKQERMEERVAKNKISLLSSVLQSPVLAEMLKEIKTPELKSAYIQSYFDMGEAYLFSDGALEVPGIPSLAIPTAHLNGTRRGVVPEGEVSNGTK